MKKYRSTALYLLTVLSAVCLLVSGCKAPEPSGTDPGPGSETAAANISEGTETAENIGELTNPEDNSEASFPEAERETAGEEGVPAEETSGSDPLSLPADSPAEEETATAEAASSGEEALSDDFFDDALFIGDSVTMGLRNFVTSERNKGNDCLGKAQFLAAGSMGYTNSLPAPGTPGSIHPVCQGKEVTIEDGVQMTGAKKIFILLGMNDFCPYPLETCMKNVSECVARILDKNPDVSIYLQSVTPTLNNNGRFNNTNIDAFNEGLRSLCEEMEWTYVDIASVMKDENGALISSYCSDPQNVGVHMTFSGCRAWAGYLTSVFADPDSSEEENAELEETAADPETMETAGEQTVPSV